MFSKQLFFHDIFLLRISGLAIFTMMPCFMCNQTQNWKKQTKSYINTCRFQFYWLTKGVNPTQLLWENFPYWHSWQKWPIKVIVAKLTKTITIGKLGQNDQGKLSDVQRKAYL